MKPEFHSVPFSCFAHCSLYQGNSTPEQCHRAGTCNARVIVYHCPDFHSLHCRKRRTDGENRLRTREKCAVVSLFGQLYFGPHRSNIPLREPNRSTVSFAIPSLSALHQIDAAELWVNGLLASLCFAELTFWITLKGINPKQSTISSNEGRSSGSFCSTQRPCSKQNPELFAPSGCPCFAERR